MGSLEIRGVVNEVRERRPAGVSMGWPGSISSDITSLPSVMSLLAKYCIKVLLAELGGPVTKRPCGMSSASLFPVSIQD